MSAIDKFKAHYEASERRKLHIEELALDVYCRPMTIGEQSKIDSKVKAKEGNHFDAAVYTIIEKCEDENGAKLFTLDDKQALMKFSDAKLLADLGNWIVSGGVDHEKNS
tara:strand:- start:4272 stop:4598 length:327 start_codon:yes stop_codon:yes gene_type:complete